MTATDHPLLVAVMGETSSGKTNLAEDIARRLDAQLINADSFQTYRGMDIGTAKSEHKERYRLIDIKNPDEPFGVGEWVLLAAEILNDLYKQNENAVVVGGSGLNIRALFQGYAGMSGAPDPDLRQALNEKLARDGLPPLVEELLQLQPSAATSVDLNNPVRVTRALEKALNPGQMINFELAPFHKVKFAISHSVHIINDRILNRTQDMIENGWIGEVDALKHAGYGPRDPGFRAHGYRELWKVLEGQLRLEEAIDSINLQVRRYAKRQRTWLKTEPGLIVLESNVETTLVDRALAHLFAIGEGAVENGQDH